MTSALADILAARLRTIGFMDRVVGLARLHESTINDGDATRVVKVPVPHSFTATDCERDNRYLLPDATTGNIWFFEDGGESTVRVEGVNYKECTLRLLGWINPFKLTVPLTENRLQVALESALSVGKRFHAGDYLDVLITATTLASEASLFSRYTYSGDTTPLLYPPYQLVGMELRCRYRLAAACALTPLPDRTIDGDACSPGLELAEPSSGALVTVVDQDGNVLGSAPPGYTVVIEVGTGATTFAALTDAPRANALLDQELDALAAAAQASLTAAIDAEAAAVAAQVAALTTDILTASNAAGVAVDAAAVAQQTADAAITGLDTKASLTYVDARFTALVAGAPGALDTLAEIAAQLATDEAGHTALVASVGNKVDKVTGKGLSTNDYTTAEQTKLAGIEALATHNSTDGQLRDRTTHTGSQAISTVTGLQAALDAAQASGATHVDTFTASGTWTKPAGVAWVQVICIGGGGGGGAGRKGAAATNRTAGGGGAGGGYSDVVLPASTLGSTVAVTVGAAGAAAPAVTVNSTSGTNGGNGGTSQFGAYIKAGGGTGGGGGQTSGGGGAGVAGIGLKSAGGAAGIAQANGNTGGAGSAATWAGAGGGAGGGILGSNVATQGGAGGGQPLCFAGTMAGGAAGILGVAGGAGQSDAVTLLSTGGGGGGGNTTGAGGAGGAGGNYGGGGGGGGASQDSVGDSGAGGAGGAGLVIVISY